MARHFIFLDSLEKLSIAKDSTLMFALTLQQMGRECWLIFEEDMAYQNYGLPKLRAYSFEGKFQDDGCYLESFELSADRSFFLGIGDTIHMRLDPPFDGRYLRYLWLLGALEKQGVNVLNRPSGILQFNEKIYAYEHPSSLDSFVGCGEKALESFIEKVDGDDFIIKPLDLFQGIGVEKASRQQLIGSFQKKVIEFSGPVVVQPFSPEVHGGEVRALYFQGREIGSILKVPPQGDYLANIARGAKFHRHELTPNERQICQDITNELMNYGVDWVAFDLLAGHLSEVNITCPGLLVEVSKAYERNLARDIVEMLGEESESSSSLS